MGGIAQVVHRTGGAEPLQAATVAPGSNASATMALARAVYFSASAVAGNGALKDFATA
ncbi:MAG: hypothetical protein U1F68_01955 [Gammaproteobacteria bacterium]